MGRGINGEAPRYRTAMTVREIIQYRSGDTFPLCPRCGISLEREYQRFCDRCGQRLGWNRFHEARVVKRF